MKKFFSLIAAVLFAGSMMAAEAVLQYTGGVTANMVGDGANNAATLGLDADLFTVLADKGSNQNLPGLNQANDIRLYADKNSGNGNIITVSIASGTITSIVLDIKQTATFVVKAGETAVTEAGGAYAINAASFSIQNTTTGATTQLRLNKITITYENGDVPPTPTVNYYVAGNMNEWKANDAYMLTPSNNGEYKGEFTFVANAEFKVIGFDGETTTWFPEGMDNNFQITEAGDYKITFNPAGNVEGWHGGFFNVVMKEAPAAISCLEVYQKAKNDAVLLNPVTVTYSNGANVWVMDGSASMLIYLPSGFTNNFQAGDVLSGVAGTVDIYQNIVYEVKPDATQAAAIVATPGEAPAPSQAAVIEASDVNKYVILPGFSIKGEFTAASKTSLPAALGEDTVTIYNNFKFAYTFEAGKTYNITGVVSAYKGNPQVYFISAEEAGGVPPTPSINYYVAGNMNEWKANDAYMLTPSNNGEYKGEFTFVANAEFKVIGFDGETTTWFPEGMDNNFQITEAGDYKITFNPAGNVEGWYEGFFNVIKKEEPVIPQYEVAEAIAAGLTDNTEIMVRGIITKMEFKGANFAKYGSVNIYVADATDAEGEFEFFNCYSLNADTFRTSIPNYDPTDKNWAQFREVVDAKGNAIHVGDTVIAFGKYKLYNSKHELNTGCYLVDIKSAPVAPAQDVDITIADGSFSDYVESYGYWMVEAQNVDYYISLSNDNTQITQAAGTYTAADLYAEDSYILTETDSISFVSGSIVLAVDAEGVATVTGSLVGNDGKTYNLNITCQAPDPHMYDEDSDFNRNFASYTIDDQYLADDGDLMIIAKDESGYQIVLDLYVPTGATGLTAGAYPINDTYEANSVAAGMYDSGNIYASYAGKGDSEGLSNVWYLVSGTVTVDENLNITIDALNSLGHSVKATLSADSGTGIEETLAAGKAAKTLRNGHILILKGDKTYNVLGAHIR